MPSASPGTNSFHSHASTLSTTTGAIYGETEHRKVRCLASGERSTCPAVPPNSRHHPPTLGRTGVRIRAGEPSRPLSPQDSDPSAGRSLLRGTVKEEIEVQQGPYLVSFLAAPLPAPPRTHVFPDPSRMAGPAPAASTASRARSHSVQPRHGGRRLRAVQTLRDRRAPRGLRSAPSTSGTPAAGS